MGWIPILISAVVAFLKGIFGTDKPMKTTVITPTPEVEVTDGKSPDERLKDFGL